LPPKNEINRALVAKKNEINRALVAKKLENNEYMEDVLLTMPTADISLLSSFAQRMGWKMVERKSAIDRFIAACKKNASSLSDDEIQNEINAVRYTA